MLGLERVWGAVQRSPLGGIANGAVLEAKRLGQLAKSAEGLPEQFIAISAFTVRDKLMLATGAAPKGPFPSLKDLQQKFPQAGLPDVMMGTTIDDAALSLPGATPESLMDRAKSMGFNTVRLGAYWDTIQPTKDGKPDFSQLDALMAAAKQRGIRVVLTVGAKAPNWPEFHYPAWATPADKRFPDRDQAFRALSQTFVRMVSQRYADESAIAMWQVENEPLDRVGPDRGVLSADALAQEAAILRQADGGRRPLMINVGATGEHRPQLQQAYKLADIVGIDVYKTIPGSLGAFERTVGLPLEALRLSKLTGKPAMIGELQADDWGSYKTNAADTVALAKQLQSYGYRDMLFWRLAQNVRDDLRGDTSLARAETTFAREALAIDGKPKADPLVVAPH